MKMFANFGHGKCPMCGDFGKKMNKKAGKGKADFRCRNCNLVFDNYFIYAAEEPGEQQKFWN